MSQVGGCEPFWSVLFALSSALEMESHIWMSLELEVELVRKFCYHWSKCDALKSSATCAASKVTRHCVSRLLLLLLQFFHLWLQQGKKKTKLCPYYHCQQLVDICPVCEINLQPRPDSMTSLFYNFTAHCFQCPWYSKVNIFPEQTQYMPPESCYPLVMSPPILLIYWAVMSESYWSITDSLFGCKIH